MLYIFVFKVKIRIKLAKLCFTQLTLVIALYVLTCILEWFWHSDSDMLVKNNPESTKIYKEEKYKITFNFIHQGLPFFFFLVCIMPKFFTLYLSPLICSVKWKSYIRSFFLLLPEDNHSLLQPWSWKIQAVFPPQHPG